MYWAVIMAGGSGTRLWPLSREKHPKQSLKLVGDWTMFQHAVRRLEPLFPTERILAVTRAEYAALLRELEQRHVYLAGEPHYAGI